MYLRTHVVWLHAIDNEVRNMEITLNKNNSEIAVMDSMLAHLQNSMHAELDAMDEQRLKKEVSSESRLKQLIAFFKAIQGVNEMANRTNNNDNRSCEGVDILEFRRELERHIKALEEKQENESVR